MTEATPSLPDAAHRVSDAEPVLVRLEAAVLAARLAMAEAEFTPETRAAAAELIYSSLERATAKADALHHILLGPATDSSPHGKDSK